MSIEVRDFGSTIKKGYVVSIDSWENDGDHSQTKTIFGLEKDEVEFLKDFLSLFKSCNSVKNCHGNEYFNYESVFSDLYGLWSLHSKFIKSKMKIDYSSIADEDELDDYVCSNPEKHYDSIYQYICDLLGYPVEYDGGFVRVFESITVNYLKDDLTLPKLKKIK